MTLVPDLYRGKTTEDYEEAGHMMDTLDYPGAVLDIRGAARYLRSRGCLKVRVSIPCCDRKHARNIHVKHLFLCKLSSFHISTNSCVYHKNDQNKKTIFRASS